MRHSFKLGFGFGSTSGVITTLGLMTSLHSSTHSKTAVIGGILAIAIADAFSDALGMHISVEAGNRHTTKEVWEATMATFFSKFIIALSFILPVLFFSLGVAVIINIIWGLLLISLVSFFIAMAQREKPHKIILEHLFITVLVIIIT
ncbi:MAG: hypothetical protein J7M03_04670, partial [Candidatus Desulfofervidaceae bacterium]|nr:hypothetical protein [Candidatus Desulfofervidaceae bacterium]